MESLEINPHIYSQLIIDKERKNIQWKKDSLFNKWCWESWIAAYISMRLEHSLTPYTKVNSKWLKDLNIRPDTIKIPRRHLSKTFSDINRTSVFLGQSPKAIEMKAKINQCGIPNMAQWLTNPTRNHEVAGSIPGLAQWIKDLALL